MSSIVTDFTTLDPTATYSYADYLLWQFEERVEFAPHDRNPHFSHLPRFGH
ncbi:MAG: hypothetical protein MUE30_19000 [Spirosomaceae bacterium]|nr:hypothetical protein [Spirosomataceae bacterium]